MNPGGTLIINEALATVPFVQITFGMTDGWWLFAASCDPERIGQDSPLLSWRQWEALLLQQVSVSGNFILVLYDSVKIIDNRRF